MLWTPRQTIPVNKCCMMFHALMHLHLLFVQFQIKQMIWQHMLFSRQHMKQCLHDSGATLCNVLFPFLSSLSSNTSSSKLG